MKLSKERKEKIRQSNKDTYAKLSDVEKKRRAKLISRRNSGKSTTGLINWDKVNEIRRLHSDGNNKKSIQQKFHNISIYTINDIIANRTWKKPPVGLKPKKPKLDF